MKPRLLQFALAVTLALGGYWWGHSSVTVVHAQESISVPRSYGKLVGTPAGWLVFEDTSGTIRMVEVANGRVDATIARN